MCDVCCYKIWFVIVVEIETELCFRIYRIYNSFYGLILLDPVRYNYRTFVILKRHKFDMLQFNSKQNK